MPYTLPVSFDVFLENITLKGDHTETARTRAKKIVELLGKTFEILEAFPTGSIVRDTALKGIADVDVLVALHYSKHIKDKTPGRVLEDVREALSGYNAKLVKKNGQAVTLYFETWPNVDIVPAARNATDGKLNYYEIPDANRGVWIETHPAIHDAAINSLSTKQRQLIRMVKIWNQAHSSYLQSYHIEVLVRKFPDVTGGWPFEIRYFFEKAIESLASAIYHPDGAPGRVDDYLSSGDRAEARTRLVKAKDWAVSAQDAVSGNRNEEAIRLYRLIFGNKFPAYG